MDRFYDEDYQEARHKAWLNALRARLTGRGNRLLPFEEVRSKLHLGGPIYRGRQVVPVKSIVGSVNRYRDFDRAFMPRSTADPWRWRSVNRAYYRFEDLPPVSLYQVGQAYFVVDGHNRVSVARDHGVEFIDADVLEVKARVPVTGDVDAADLEILGEYESFLERTGLDRIRPEQQITFTAAGGYTRLLEHIAAHRCRLAKDPDCLSAERGQPPEPEAVADWYDHEYLPVAEAIRGEGMLAGFPGRTEADLYLWLMEYLHESEDEAGTSAPPDPVALQRVLDDLRRRALPPAPRLEEV